MSHNIFSQKYLSAQNCQLLFNSKSDNNVDDGDDYMIYFDDNIDEDEHGCVIGVGKLPWCHPLGSLDGNQAGAGCP